MYFLLNQNPNCCSLSHVNVFKLAECPQLAILIAKQSKAAHNKWLSIATSFICIAATPSSSNLLEMRRISATKLKLPTGMRTGMSLVNQARPGGQRSRPAITAPSRLIKRAESHNDLPCPSWIFIERFSLVLMKVQTISIMGFFSFLGGCM